MKRGGKGPLVRISDQQSRAKLFHSKIKRLTKQILLKLHQRKEIRLVFVSDPTIRRLNRQFHGHHQTTDVLAFEVPSHRLFQNRQRFLLGEIIISIDRTFVNARRFQVAPSEELMRYVAHGILHLLGARDEKPREREKMFRRQEVLLRKLGPVGWLVSDGSSKD